MTQTGSRAIFARRAQVDDRLGMPAGPPKKKFFQSVRHGWDCQKQQLNELGYRPVRRRDGSCPAGTAFMSATLCTWAHISVLGMSGSKVPGRAAEFPHSSWNLALGLGMGLSGPRHRKYLPNSRACEPWCDREDAYRGPPRSHPVTKSLAAPCIYRSIPPPSRSEAPWGVSSPSIICARFGDA